MNPCPSPITLPLLPLLLQSKLRSSGGGSSSCGYSGRQLLREYAARELNAFLWIFLSWVTLVLLRRVVSILRLWLEGSKLPGPPCPSFFGHCKLFSGDNFTDVISGLHMQYGSLFKLWLGPTQLVVSVKDPALLKEILFKAADKLPLTGKAFCLAFGKSGLFRSSYVEVQKRREELLAEINTRLITRSSFVPISVLDSIYKEIIAAAAKGSIDCEDVSQHMAFTTMGAMVYGETLLTWSKASVYKEFLGLIAKDACLWASYSITPFWRKGYREYISLSSKLRGLTQELLELCRRNQRQPSANIKYTGLETAYNGLACSSAMMSDSSFDDDTYSHLSLSEELSSNVMGVMFHGYLATAALIYNVLVRLVQHPEMQDEIYSEIVVAKKASSKEDKENVDGMVVLTAAVYESARLLPTWPMLQRCSLENDLHLKSGVTIPAGAVLVVPLQLVQMDGSSWGKDASDFNPYRFLSTVQKKSDSENIIGEFGQIHSSKSYVLNDPNENAAFLPFGSGACACVGQKFVIHGVVSLISSLLEQFKIQLKPGSETDLKSSTSNSALQLRSGPEIVFIKRTN